MTKKLEAPVSPGGLFLMTSKPRIIAHNMFDQLLISTSFEYQAAIDVLFEYLTKGALSPLQQQLVEIEEPFCSDVSFDFTTYSQGHLVSLL